MRSIVLAAALATTCLCAPALAQSNQSDQGKMPQQQGQPAGMPQNSSIKTGSHATQLNTNGVEGHTGVSSGSSANTSGASSANAAGSNAANTSQSAASGSKVQYVTNNPNLWGAKKLEGVNIYNDQDKKVGAIDDVLVDRNGRVKAILIGVGGFLGIGQRDVAVSFDSLQWQMNKNSGNTAETNGQGVHTANSSAGGASTGSDHNANRDAPVRAILPGATKQALENAPEFKYAH